MPRVLRFCGTLSAVLWGFAIVFAVLAAIKGSVPAQASEFAFMLCATILLAAYTIGVVLYENG
jgi:hypothetical protein